MTTPQRRGLNSAVTRLWTFLAPAYDLPVLQQWVYRPPHDEVIAQLRNHGSRRIADIACGTGILSDRIERELHPDEIYGIDMSDGMLEKARARSNRVNWLRGPAEQLPFEDGALDAVVTTSAFHFFDQPAALREFIAWWPPADWWPSVPSARGNRCCRPPQRIGGNLSTMLRQPRCGRCSRAQALWSAISTASGDPSGPRSCPT
jgi:SAM-dependent methyltransferase